MKKLLLGCFSLSLFFSCEQPNSNQNAGQVFYNGDILTMQGDTPTYVEAIVEVDGNIAFVGKLEEAASKFADAKKVDLQGKTLLPGFIDPHSHFGAVSNTMGQVDLNSPPVGDITDIEGVLNKLLKYKEANQIPDGEWIYAWGYDETQLIEKRHLNKMELDEILPNNPVYLLHTSGHMGVANSMALDIMEVTKDTPDPEGGIIERLPNSQEPSGLLQETAMYAFVGYMMQVLEAKQAEFFDATQEYYIENGFTTAQDAMTARSAIDFFQSQADNGKLKLDLIALGGSSELELNIKDLNWKTYNNRFKVQGTKIIADGSPQGKTAFFTKPFLTSVPGCESDCKGLPSLSQNTLNELFKTAYKDDVQLFIHANGDATIDMIIAAHEYACKELNQDLDKDRRSIIIHSQFVRKEQLDTYVKYAFHPSFFSNHAYFWGDVHIENLGEDRAFFLSPMVSADKLGLKYTNHSDATVTPLSPMFSLWTAVNRTSRTGKIIGEAEKATPYQALKAITSHAAYQIFEEDSKGSLTVGKLADFVILDENPLKINPEKIKDIQINQTIKEGKTIFQKQ